MTLLSRSRRRALAGVVAAVAALASVAGVSGCGLPSRTEPKYAGPAPSPAVAQGGVQSPPRPGDERTTEELITAFLRASVGANLPGAGAEPDANKEAIERMHEFMTGAIATNWAPRKAGVT